MILSADVLAEMLGAELADAVVAAQSRLDDPTVMARCDKGLWLVERAAAVLHQGLTYAEAVAAVGALP